MRRERASRPKDPVSVRADPAAAAVTTEMASPSVHKRDTRGRKVVAVEDL
jgi:hypothetical protein